MRKGAKFAKISIAQIYITRFYPALINPHKVQNYKVTYNRKVNKEINKQNKEKIEKNNKYIEMYLKIYKNIPTWKYTNI